MPDRFRVNPTWDNEGIETNMHLGPSLTWEQKVCNFNRLTVRHTAVNFIKTYRETYRGNMNLGLWRTRVNMHLGRICTWDNDGLGTNMHFGPSLTWDQKVCNLNQVTVRHLGPIRTLYQYGPYYMADLGHICTWDHNGLGTNMHLRLIFTWDHDGLGTISLRANMHLEPICTWDHDEHEIMNMTDLG